MKKILPFISINFVISIILLFNNISRIPIGDEMGAIGETFLSLFYALIIFTITIALSIGSDYIFKKGQIYIQIFIHGTCVFLIFYSSYKVCIYREPYISSKEVKNLNE